MRGSQWAAGRARGGGATSRPSLPKAPFFWGKTGTLTHTCCLAGYLRCQSGRRLAVVFFNNNLPGDDQPTRDTMQRLLTEVRGRL